MPIHITDNKEEKDVNKVSHGLRHTTRTIIMVTIVLDNGASTIKVGIVDKDELEQPRLGYFISRLPFNTLLLTQPHIFFWYFKTGSFPMLLLGQREINQHTLAMKWHNARIIRLFIIVYPLKRFLKNFTHHPIFMLKNPLHIPF